MSALAAVTLDDKYALESGRVYLTGTQALVRLPMMQRQRDQAAGLNTACFITGYRGSPLGGFDQALWRAQEVPAQQPDPFPARRERGPGGDRRLGQRSRPHLFGDNKHDGVFAMWYGKGPGVDRSGDVLRHGNLAGTSRHGGVLALAGDDHTCKSSTTAHQSEYAFMDAMIPILTPSDVQEILDLGPAWLGHVALFRLLGGVQGDVGDGRQLRLGLCRSAAGSRSMMPDGFRPCRRTA